MNSIGRLRHNLLNRLLNLPQLVANVQALPAEKFHHIIKQIGLEDCGELVSLATPKQLQELFDIDLWANSKPGEAEQFDSDRFMRWLEILFEAGESVLLEKVLDMDVELLVFGLASQLFVYPSAQLMSLFQYEADTAHEVDIRLESVMYEELYEFQIFARNLETFDVVFALLVAMDTYAHDTLLDILQRLAVLGEQQVDETELCTVLSQLEEMAENVAHKREERRGARGYVSAQDARAFLRLAQVKSSRQLIEESTTDAVTAAYMRRFDPLTAPGSDQSPLGPSYQAIWEVIEAADLAPFNDGTAALLPGNVANNQERLLVAFQRLSRVSKPRHGQQSTALGYLGNVVVSGCTLDGRRFRSVEASAAVIATCALGMERYLAQTDSFPRSAAWEDVLQRVSLVQLFLVGWKALSGADSRVFPFYSNNDSAGSIRFFDSISSLESYSTK